MVSMYSSDTLPNIYIATLVDRYMAKKNTLGISVKRSEDVQKWFTEVITKAELIEYTGVSGCYILRPWAYAIWEKIQEFFDTRIKEMGVKNSSFPLLIPESLLTKEANHIEGFAPEVAWVTHHGDTKMAERLAIRPTSETIMYEAYSKWIRSHRDLPLKLNQWCSVVRWEFKQPQPFLRSREFLWQEGHTAFATKDEAVKEVHDILNHYAAVFEELMAIPVLKGKKSEKEKFAGADFTTSVEVFLPNGKAIQGATSHHLGQNFSKPFDINFKAKDDSTQFAWQNSWGISTRAIGVLIFMHGDDNGLVLPPMIAPLQAVIVPILFDSTRERVLEKANEVYELLKGDVRIELDDRDEYKPGFKFNHWELKGVPVRIEIGPKDVEMGGVTLVRRDNREKVFCKFDKVEETLGDLMSAIQDSLYINAKRHLSESIVKVTTMDEFEKVIKKGKIAFAPWCGTPAAEEIVKEKTMAKSLNSPFKQEAPSEKCFITGQDAKMWTYFARSL
jgi:prolyl-tRNA synthetase family I